MSTEAVTPQHDVPPTPSETSPLPDDPTVLKAYIQELLTTLQTERRENGQLRHRLDELLRRLYGPRAEKIDPDQLQLFIDKLKDMPSLAPHDADTKDSRDDAPSEAEPTPRKKQGHGRRKLPGDLPRQRIEHDLPDAEKPCSCCGQERHRIGEEVSEQLDYQPSSLFIVEHARIKYACKQCEGEVRTAAKPVQPIDKGLPGPGLLAQVAVSKYADHLPLHRLERIFGRQGVTLSRKTMCDWMAAGAMVLKPLYQLMVDRVVQSRVLHTDDTVVPVQDGNRNSIRQARAWVYIGDAAHPVTVFDYTPNRKRDGPVEFLEKFTGYLHADAYGGYDGIFIGSNNAIHEVACWAHARRKFYEAKKTDPERALTALAWIRRLYDVEDEAKKEKLSAKEWAALRQEKARPLLKQFKKWLEEQRKDALPKSPFGNAARYALNQWDALHRYTDDGALAIDNNIAERALRKIALGRKNWLFAGSDNGGRTAAVWFTIMATCARHNLDPWAYLRDVLTRLPTLPADQLPTLLPNLWQPIPAQ